LALSGDPAVRFRPDLLPLHAAWRRSRVGTLTVLWSLAVLALLAGIGTPLFVVIAAGALWSFHAAGVDLSVVAIEFFGLAETPVLLAIPLFTFAGFLLSHGAAPQRLVRLSQALLGWLPGGLAII